jgi:glycosyltransferase involved in cell wall biosynthesis
MVICHLTSVHSSADTRIFYKQLISLANAGYNTYLIAPGDSRVEKGVTVIGINNNYSGRIMRMTKLTKAIYKKAREVNAEVYHLHDPELIPVGVKLKKIGKKVIFDSHEDYVEAIKDKQYIPRILRKVVSRCYGFYQINKLKQYSALIAATPSVFYKLLEINPCTIMITNYPIVNKQVNNTYAMTKRLVFAGGITRQWMHHIILDALLMCDDVQYVLCGKGSEDYLEELMDHDAWEKVEYRGIVPFEEVADIIAGCSVGVVVLDYVNNVGGESKLGNLSNTKLFENMLAGLPVICTDFILWKEIIDKYECGICVDPRDSVMLAKAIDRLLDDYTLAKEMGMNGRRAVKEEYNWKSQELKLIELYKKLEKNNCVEVYENG